MMAEQITCHKCGDEVNYVIGCGYSATYECSFCGFMIMLAHNSLDQSAHPWEKESGRYRFYHHLCMHCDKEIPKGKAFCNEKCDEGWNSDNLKDWMKE